MYYSPTALKKFAEFLQFDEEIIVYDLETTGLEPVAKGKTPEAHIIQVAAKKMQHWYAEGFEPVDERCWYIKPIESIPDLIVEKTGITDEFLADKPSEGEVFQEIRDYFGKDMILAGYNNISFDDRFMDVMYRRYGESFKPKLSIDIYKLSQLLVSPGDVKNYKLETIANHFGFGDNMFHNACGDVTATKSLMELYEQEILENYDRTGVMVPETSGGIKVCVTGVSRYEREKISRIYVNTSDRNVSFYMNTWDLGWGCKDKNLQTNRFNMPDMISQALRIARCSSEEELAKFR